MLIPLNTPERQDLCLSVIRLNDGQYSVAIVSIVNGLGMDSLPSWRKLLPDDEETEPVTWQEDFEIIKGSDLYECIEKCINQVIKTE